MSTVPAKRPPLNPPPILRRRRGAVSLRPEGSVQEVSHQFEDLDQQNESYTVGMWVFLVTEIMFFGGLFMAYIVFRARFPEAFVVASQQLDWKLGFINTLVLLTSSLTMAFAVRNAQLARKKQTLICLGLTLLCAFGFMVIKGIEYTSKWNHHLVPGPTFHLEVQDAARGGGQETPTIGRTSTSEQTTAGVGEVEAKGVNQQQAQLYFGLYFAMTGLHGVHVVIGILVLAILGGLVTFNAPAVRDYMPIEMTGLYWHFVDIVWIFLYPLMYLINPVL